MDGSHERLMDELNVKRQDRLMKWTHVAGQLNMSVQHLLRIRQGKVPLTRDVAIGIDQFLERDRGYAWNLLNPEAPPDIEWPTDDEIIAMSVPELREFSFKVQDASGPLACEDWLFHALSVRRDARRKAPVVQSSDA